MLKIVVKVVGVLALLVIVAAVGALIYADVAYQAVRSAPRVSHETYALPEARIRVAVDPSLANDLIGPRIQQAGVPDWVAALAMPYEAAALLTPDVDQASVDVLVFLNTPRFAPLFTKYGTLPAFNQAVPFVAWRGPGLLVQERGVLTTGGSMTIGANDMNLLETYWGRVSGVAAEPVPKGHFISATLANRDGSVFMLLAALKQQGAFPPTLPMQEVAKNMLAVGDVSIVADPAGSDALDIRFEVNGAPTADDKAMGTLDFTLGVLLSGMGKELEEKHGLTFQGTRQRDGHAIVGDYTLSNIGNVLP